jgi:hypothetical protein
MKLHVCVGCGRSFHRRSHGLDKLRYCSRPCFHASYWGPRSRRIRPGVCRACGWGLPHRARRVCSAECLRREVRRWWRTHSKSPLFRLPRCCPECGAWFCPLYAGRVWCSRACTRRGVRTRRRSATALAFGGRWRHHAVQAGQWDTVNELAAAHAQLRATRRTIYYTWGGHNGP